MTKILTDFKNTTIAKINLIKPEETYNAALSGLKLWVIMWSEAERNPLF